MNRKFSIFAGTPFEGFKKPLHEIVAGVYLALIGTQVHLPPLSTLSPVYLPGVLPTIPASCLHISTCPMAGANTKKTGNKREERANKKDRFGRTRTPSS